MSRGLKREQYDWEALEKKRSLVSASPYCVYCQVPLDVQSGSVDHLIPRSRGGEDKDENLVLSCRPCNYAKADLLPLNFIWMRV